MLETDHIVLAVGRRAENQLLEEMKDLVPEIIVVGDCLSPRKVKDAIWESFKTARVI
jgi:hypothetical protein